VRISDNGGKRGVQVRASVVVPPRPPSSWLQPAKAASYLQGIRAASYLTQIYTKRKSASGRAQRGPLCCRNNSSGNWFKEASTRDEYC
jgi:hypothetical protein